MQELSTDSYPKELVNLINSSLKTTKSFHIKSKFKKCYQSEYKSILMLTAFLGSDAIFTERIYCIINEIHRRPKCPVCNKYVKFNKLNKGYRIYCSFNCGVHSQLTLEKRCRTCNKKYGVSYASKSDIVKKKMIETSIERFGVKNPYQSNKIKDKIKNTLLMKYGVEYPMQSRHIREKSIASCLEKYGVENPSKSTIIKNRKIETSRKRWNVDFYSQSDDCKQKIIEKKISNGTLVWPSIGKKEKDLLDKIEEDSGIKLRRQYRIGRFFVDGYDDINNVVYEVYEPFHFDNEEKIQHDIKRQTCIQNKIGCKFVILTT